MNLRIWLLSCIATASVAAEEYCVAAPAIGLPKLGQCRPISDTSVKYVIEVVPVTGRGFSLNVDVGLAIDGPLGTSDRIMIATEEAGVLRKQQIPANEVGPPSQLRVTLMSTGGGRAFKVARINVAQDFKWWQFDCPNHLDDLNPEISCYLSGNKLYSVSVQTGVIDQVLFFSSASTHGTVEIEMMGLAGKTTGSKLLLQGASTGSLRTATLRGADVGAITEIRLTNLAQDDPWYCAYVDIRSDDGSVVHFDVRRWIGKPYEAAIVVDISSTGNLDLPPQDVECLTRASDIISGFPETLEITKVQCPMNCGNDPFGFVKGASVHPASSSICKAAIVDGVLSPSGGELVVTVMGELPAYFEPAPGAPISPNVPAVDYDPSPDRPSFAYFVYQSHSIDNIEKDVRVVDAYGKLSNIGRLEIRRKNQWGSVCSRGDLGSFNQAAARKACQELGYLHGIFLENPGCALVGGMNVCSTKGYQINAAAIQCTGAEKSLAECTFEEPPAICSDRIFDVAVQCTNFPPDREPPQGTLRLVDHMGAPAVTTATGRVEIYLNGVWGTICDDGWTAESAAVACREMGYSGVRPSPLGSTCEDVEGVNFCGEDKQRINAVNVGCNGSEKNLRNCPHETSEDIYCVHSEDVVLRCEGDGDPSGMGYFTREDPLDVRMRPLPPVVNLTCSQRALAVKELTGLPGTTRIARCPAGCTVDGSVIKGTLIYTDDSSVCRAAIHAGSIDDSGGEIVFVVGHGQRSYAGTTRAGIESEASSAGSRSFMTSKVVPSLKANLAPGTRQGDRKYAGDSAFSVQTTGLGASERFQQAPGSGPSEVIARFEPLFAWCPPPNFEGFSHRNYVNTQNYPDAKLVNAVRSFSVSIRARLKKTDGHTPARQTLLAHSECDGFSITIDETGELIFEQICHPLTLRSGFKPKVEEWFHATVTYVAAQHVAAFYIDGKKMAQQAIEPEFELRTKLTIGRSSDLESEYFTGEISCVRVFGFALTPEQISNEEQLIQRPKQACPPGSIGGSAAAVRSRYTVDGRLCISPCVVSEESPASFNAASSVLDTESSVQLKAPSFAIGCSDTLLTEQFNGETEDKFLVRCPPHCLKNATTQRAVFGTRVYAAESSICLAALHQGQIREETGGLIDVTVQSGLAQYEGSSGENGIDSSAKETASTRSFVLHHAQPPRLIDCSHNALFLLRSSVPTARALVSCPEKCSSVDLFLVYGTDVYSPKSAICRAAIHAGVLTDAGGEVLLELWHSSNFEGSVRNGIRSNDAEMYLRSIRFPQSRTSGALCTNYDFGTQRRKRDEFHLFRFFWREVAPSPWAKISDVGPQFSFSSNGTITATPGAISDERLLLLRQFQCDHVRMTVDLHLEEDLSASPFFSFQGDSGTGPDRSSESDTLIAGIIVAYQDPTSYFVLKLTRRYDGSGNWSLERTTNEERVPTGLPQEHRFEVGSPLTVVLEVSASGLHATASSKEHKTTEVARFQRSLGPKVRTGTVGFLVESIPPGIRLTFDNINISTNVTKNVASDFVVAEASATVIGPIQVKSSVKPHTIAVT